MVFNSGGIFASNMQVAAAVNGGVFDPYFAKVSLLLSFEGTDGDTTTTDGSSTGHTVSMVNGAQIDDAQFKFGSTSALFDGVNDGVLIEDHAEFSFGSGEFTVEGWFRWNTIQDINNGLLGQWDVAARKWLIRWTTSGILEFYTSPNGTALTETAGSWTPSLNVWYHIAADRDASNVIRTYVDGVVIASATDATDIFDASSTQVSIGHYAEGNRELDGWVNEVRITKGLARYAGAFTPPAAAFPRPA